MHYVISLKPNFNLNRTAADFAIDDKFRATLAGIERHLEFFAAVGTDDVYSR